MGLSLGGSNAVPSRVECKWHGEVQRSSGLPSSRTVLMLCFARELGECREAAARPPCRGPQLWSTATAFDAAWMLAQPRWCGARGPLLCSN